MYTSRGQSQGCPSMNYIDGDDLQQFWAILEVSRDVVRKNPLISGKVSASYLVGGKIEEIGKTVIKPITIHQILWSTR